MYQLFGLRFRSNIAFPELPAAAGAEHAPADLTFSVHRALPAEFAPAGGRRLVYRTEDPVDGPVLSISMGEGDCLFTFHGRATFLVHDGAAQVSCVAGTGVPEGEIRFRFLGLVVSFVLHHRGCDHLHASAVRIGDGAVAFLAPSGGGKSTLVATFVRAGHALLSDDLLPIEISDETVRVRSGSSQIRMWPDAAEALWGSAAPLPRVIAGADKRQVLLPRDGERYCDRPLSLRAIYLLRQGEGRCCIEPLSRRRALLSLVFSTYGMFLLSGDQLARQMSLYRDVAARVPCRMLLLPEGFDRLAAAYEAILEDVEAVAAAGVNR